MNPFDMVWEDQRPNPFDMAWKDPCWDTERDSRFDFLAPLLESPGPCCTHGVRVGVDWCMYCKGPAR